MGTSLPNLSHDEFVRRLRRVSPEPISELQFNAMWRHFQELKRWNARLSLVGPGTADEIVERHFGEALAALPLLRRSDKTMIDVGSGGGFPGLVLAVARPQISTLLIEPRERKWSFLMSSIRQCQATEFEMSCQAINSRVADPLPPSLILPSSIDVVTSRALNFSSEMIAALLEHSPAARFLLWTSQEQRVDLPGLRVSESLEVVGSRQRRIVEMVPR